MKFLHLTLIIFVAFLVTEGLAEKTRKHKKYRKRKPVLEATEFSDAGKSVEKNDVETPPEETNEEIIDNRVPLIDPCIKVHCGAGRVCEVDSEGEPQCVCIPTCPIETEPRRKVCSNHNETWTSDCAVYQQRCLCDRGDPECKGEQYKHVHIEYYGECREMKQCTKEEMADFPRRMRDWLFNIMRDLADRSELTPHYLKMEREAESNMTRRWANAAVWKFCDLDGFPPDRSVSRHELFPIRAPLMALEHCIAPFLNSCDANDDHRINIKEWAQCLELEEDVIEQKCEDINDDEE
ncbi:SPARC [Tribolium castaneum]|uniref:SPARC-like Protein n=1 Tax=Tribolium castaneum TaxID=7070 RepID=D6W950_TRICA|nr:PREDICTED: SPARC [Tribolium castaneum]EEZ98441.1 SPARC-like Protein [Tribolium castaneum]|eukprot:XP_975465.1 PREDICTED: SPARC [Tribolium castaneum]